jgi:hypothetical protein
MDQKKIGCLVGLIGLGSASLLVFGFSNVDEILSSVAK